MESANQIAHDAVRDVDASRDATAGSRWTRTSLALKTPLARENKIMSLQGTRSITSLLSIVWLFACAPVSPSIAPPVLPPGVFGVYEDNDVGALNQSSWAFAIPQRTHDDPIDAARAVIAVEYLADELPSNPRWVGMDVTSTLGMIRARKDTRRVLGIVQDAPPRIVVEALLRLTAALSADDQAGAIRVLGSPVFFTRPPSQTLHILSNLPYIQSANIATLQAANAVLVR
jgi:hypothetical protein